ncbi:hypothetical protein [Paenibacillus senegalensis]|uniref:hypothetical protein n=1 Tax=Paenibacillus senegalensis TaxID=1465766 RepID=UPI000289D884|nr:hypothetical protein [Paenibacillus senegalensis]
MKKLKNPGDNISLKTKKSEDPAIMEWINSQSNLMDSIRYLIENEVRQNGVRNLQSFIPADRSIASAPMIQAGQGAGIPARALVSSADEVAAAAAPNEAHASTEAVEETAVSEEAEEDSIDDEDIESWL